MKRPEILAMDLLRMDDETFKAIWYGGRITIVGGINALEKCEDRARKLNPDAWNNFMDSIYYGWRIYRVLNWIEKRLQYFNPNS